jgi:DNA-binding NarL/FixJ family response regulator
MTDEQQETIKARKLKGDYEKDIAKDLGLRKGTVSSFCSRLNRKSPRWTSKPEYVPNRLILF